MKMLGKITVGLHTASVLERFCRIPPANYYHGEVLFDQEYKFLDGKKMVIQVIAPEDTPEDIGDETAWTKGIMFDRDGNELGCTEARESFLGEYVIPVGEHEYTIEVVIK